MAKGLNRPGFFIPPIPQEYDSQQMQQIFDAILRLLTTSPLQQGVSGEFTSADGQTVTVENGIVIEIK